VVVATEAASGLAAGTPQFTSHTLPSPPKR
jgi:hypothetical protein